MAFRFRIAIAFILLVAALGWGLFIKAYMSRSAWREQAVAASQRVLDEQAVAASQRIQHEQALAQQRTQNEQALAAQRIQHEQALAQQRTQNEQALAAQRIQNEQALATFKRLPEQTEVTELAPACVAPNQLLNFNLRQVNDIRLNLQVGVQKLTEVTTRVQEKSRELSGLEAQHQKLRADVALLDEQIQAKRIALAQPADPPRKCNP